MDEEEFTLEYLHSEGEENHILSDTPNCSLSEDGGDYPLSNFTLSTECGLQGLLLNDTNATGFPENPFYFYEVEQFAVLWILLIFIVVGNVSVIAALFLSKSRKTRTNFFIMHLAIADLSVGLISVLTDLVWKSTVSWNAGNVSCKLVRFAQVLVTYSSTYVLVALSIDRYDAITHPMNFSGSWRRARTLVKIAWALSVVFASPSLYLFEEKDIKGVTQCWIDLQEAWHWQVYMVLVSLLVLIFPTIIITACYTIIVYTIWSKSKIMTVGDPKSPSRAQNGGKRALNHEEDTRRASSRGLIPKAKIKTVKMTFVIVFVFVLCWSPYIVFDLLQVFGHIPHTQTNIAIATFMQSLAPLNSAANPLIYCLFSTHLCRNLRRIKIIDMAARALTPCCPCIRPPLDSQAAHLAISATEYTTMSDVTSRRIQHQGAASALRYMPVQRGTPGYRHRSPPVGTRIKKEMLDIEVLSFNCKPEKKSQIEGSSV